MQTLRDNIFNLQLFISILACLANERKRPCVLVDTCSYVDIITMFVRELHCMLVSFYEHRHDVQVHRYIFVDTLLLS